MTVERGRASQRSHGVASQRSYGTSSSSSQGSRARCKICCRKFVSFMCTQVGVGGLVVSYAIMGAFAFIAIEGKEEYWMTNRTSLIHNTTIRTLWNFTEHLNVLHKDQWYEDVNDTLYDFQKEIVKVVKSGYDGRSHKEVWNFPASLMFCLSVFTMIGYGHMTPKSEWGKIATIMYAVLGIPLYIVYFMNMGRVFAKSFKFLYRAMYRCINRNKTKTLEEAELSEDQGEEHTIIVPSTACMWVMIFYMTTGTIMFAQWEKWSYLNSCYFSFTSLAKIGIGDFVPGFGGGGFGRATEDSQTKLIINFMYLLIGMGIIAMCYTLMKEEILLKLRALKQDIKEKVFVCGLKLGLYMEDQPYQDSRPPPIHGRTKSVRKSVRRR
ncbi:TWiK family of potassium channels protein 18-like [Homarus americanus]|uniref:TWiK family of potassium channels protein 18-like 2 n=1 Tax=Homarus americanus TaxID=6706 RepID=A0A8J5K247_HOMAM|nr:TWiK family of potassium channels protein 18-like [Homarus americanus]KAG7166113.1 TWiK family of potassium channels protein 18-like 2 [Homarus americanus]